MAFKFIALFAFVAAASAIEYQQNYQGGALIKTVAAPVYVKKVAAYAQHEEYDAPAEYQFSYDVHDEHTGDFKSQHETRKGDAVQGQYSLIDSDGHRRIVDYTADDHHGFNAIVRREPTDIKVNAPVAKYAQYTPVAHYQQAPVAKYAQYAPVSHYQQAAPVAHYAQSPVYHQAPVAKIAQYAPVAHYAQPIAKYVAPIAKVVAPIHYAAPAHQGHYENHGAAQVSFSAPHHNYHY